MSSPARLLDTWPTLVGKFLLAFGDIELISFFLWERYFPGQTAPSNFRERTSKVIFHTQSDERISPAVGDLLRSAMQIAEKRNTVAHNPLSVQVYRHSETGELTQKLTIGSQLSKGYISDEDLVAVANQTQLLRRVLSICTCTIHSST